MDRPATVAVAATAAVAACYCAGVGAAQPAAAPAAVTAAPPTGPPAAPRCRGVLQQKTKLRTAAGRFCPVVSDGGKQQADLAVSTELVVCEESADKKGNKWMRVAPLSGSTWPGGGGSGGWVPAASVRLLGVDGVSDKYAPVAEIGTSFDILAAPQPAEWVAQARPVLLTCEHAGDTLPTGYEWGADSRLVGTHWCVDIGIREVCLEVQAALGCPAVLARYSRLFCDCNRPLPVKAAKSSTVGGQGGASAAYLTSPFCAEAEGQPIELNTLRLPDDDEVEKRLAGVWRPYHNALAALVRSSPAETTFLLSLHSYTHQFEQQPVEVGILCYPDRDLLPGKPATRLLAALQAAGINAEVNQPYSLVLGDGSLYKTHAPELESGGRENITVELRQDKIDDDPAWRATVVRCIVECMRN